MAASASPARAAASPIQRIRYADNETNYCATCQTGGKVLADRSLRVCSAPTGRALWTNSKPSSAADRRAMMR